MSSAQLPRRADPSSGPPPARTNPNAQAAASRPATSGPPYILSQASHARLTRSRAAGAGDATSLRSVAFMAAGRTCGRADGEPIGCHPEVMAGRATSNNVAGAPRCARQHEAVGRLCWACAFGTGSEYQHWSPPQAAIAALAFLFRARSGHADTFLRAFSSGRSSGQTDSKLWYWGPAGPPGSPARYGEKHRGSNWAAATAMQVLSAP